MGLDDGIIMIYTSFPDSFHESFNRFLSISFYHFSELLTLIKIHDEEYC